MSANARCRTISVAAAHQGQVRVILQLRHGGIAVTQLLYELLGAQDLPLIIVAGGISAGRHVLASQKFPEAGWWQAQGPALDPSRHRILAIDWVNADGGISLPIDPADQADAIRQLLDHLGLHRPAFFIGASYGAMVGMHFAGLFPDRIAGLLAISAADRPHPFASACRALQRQALTLGEQLGAPEEGVALARAMAMLTYRTPREFAERFGDSPTIIGTQVRVASEDYLSSHGERHRRRMNSTAYRRLSESIDLHCVDPRSIGARLTLAGVDQDALVRIEDVERMASLVPRCALRRISSVYGHDAFLKEECQVASIITEFLESPEQH